MSLTRRSFIHSMMWAPGGLAAYSSIGLMGAPLISKKSIKAIVVDFDKCAGCRTCETACSAFNHRLSKDKSAPEGLGNPSLSNIKVWRYNPPVDVPVTCFLCKDAPCIRACPVEPHAETKRKALYRDPELHTIKCDDARCISCESCACACETDRGGVIFPDENGHPRHMCTLCDGKPSCVAWCPYEALHYLEVTTSMELRNQTPDEIAQQLIAKYYELKIRTL